jgi:hypothetical protein
LTGGSSSNALRDFGFALLSAIAISSLLLALRMQPPHGGILFSLLSLVMAPLAVTVAWWFTAVLLIVALGLGLLWRFPVAAWVRVVVATVLIIVWIGCGFIWLGSNY